MEERNWKYKITSRTGLVVAAVMLALFGGVTFWLYTVHNGAFILVGCIAALTAIAFLLSVYSALFFKVFVDKDGFYFQTAPGNGRDYRYAEICDMWLSSGRETKRAPSGTGFSCRAVTSSFMPRACATAPTAEPMAP